MSDPPSLDANGHEERLWTPIDPSGILRDCSMVCENGIHSQLVLNKGSLPGSCISCNTARYGRDRLDVVSTGERLKFHKGAGGICDQLVDAEIETTKGDPVGRKTGVTVLSAIEKTENDKQTVTVQNDGNSDADKVPSDVAGSSDRNITDNLTKKHDTNNDLKRLEYWNARTQINERSGDPYADAARFDKSQIAEFADPDVEPLLQHLTNELKRLPLRRNDCDVCRRISLLTADSATGQRIVKQNIPCSHSLGLKHAPLPQSLSTESISKHAALGTEVEVYANDGSVKRKQDATEELPRRPTIYVDAVDASSDIDHVVETLLTYRQEEVHGQGYALCTTPKHDVEKLKERTVPGALRLEELDTALLQHVASRIPAKSGTTVDVVSAVKEVTKIQRTDYESQFGFDRCVSMTGTVVDPYASKTQRWICPQEFKVPGYLGRDTPRISIRTSIRESINDSFGDDATSAEPSRAVSIDDLYDARGLAPMTGSRNKDLNDDEYYDSDMTLDELMAKFVKLRKKPDCVASILRTLKHLICSRLQKERIYLRKRSGSENDNDRHVSPDNMMLVTLRRVLETVQVAELPHNSLEESSKPVLPRDDDASVYTYSSISISSYFSEHESVCLPVDDREIARGWNLNLHKRVVEFYGIITVVDENKTQIVPNNCSTVYAELVGDDLSIYDIGGTFNSNGITVESDPLVVLHLDASFTCARPRKMKRSNESVIRINAGNYVAHGVPSSNSPSDDSGVFLRLAAEHADVSRWWMAIISRLKVSSYMELLENEHRFHLSSTNLDLVNYPNLREADLSGMQFDSLLEQRIVKTYVNTPVRYLNASHRTLKDSDLIDFCAIWNFPIKTIELSHNAFLFAENQDVFIDFIKNTKVLRLYLDGNRVSAPFLQRLPELLTDGSLRYLSLRGCIVDESVKQSLTLLNRSLGLSDKVVVDVTDIVASEEILHFLRAHPFSRLKVVTDNSQLLLPERLLEKFMDVHSKESISSMGYTCSGRLISARESKLKAPVRGIRWWCKPRGMKYEVINEHAHFEFRPPYLVMYRVIRGKQNKKKPLNPIGMVLFVTGCNIARMNNLRWLHITGTPPRLVNNAWSNENEPSEDGDVEVKEMRLLVRAYSEAATRRWFEVISRSIAGINYVKYLRGHFKSVISRHILAFCSRSDASHLVLYDLPYDKELWKGFFSSLNSQSTLRVLDFTNMKLTSEQLTFSEMLFAGLKLDRLDYSFNNIDLTVASRGVFNSLMPRMLCSVYNISDNPLGDCKLSADLFVELCLKAEAVKVCMNRCKLGDYFLSSVVKALSRSNPYQGIIKLEVLELEGNSFSSGSLHEFVSYVSEFFPTLATIRLHGSVTTSSVTESTFNGHQILTLDAFSPTEPRHGKFTRIKYLQKPKRTTRDTINKLLEGGVSQALSLRYSR